MSAGDRELARLLRAAAAAPAELPPAQAPFGFETRVVALWRAGRASIPDAADLTRFVWRIGAIAFVVLTLATAGAYQQLSAEEQQTTPHTNDYAIADSAIQTEFLR